MKRWIIAIGLTIPLVVAGSYGVLILFLSCLPSDVVSQSYPTLAAAQTDIQKGWIPPILPSSTYDIQDSHHLDLNTGAGRFHFDPKQFEHFSKQGMQPQSVAQNPDAFYIQLKKEGYQFGGYTEERTTWTFALHASGNGYWLEYQR